MKTPLKSDFFPALHSLLEGHLALFPLPYRACACVGRKGGKVRLAVRFVANASSWSHVAEAGSLSQAVARIRGKLAKDASRLGTDASLSSCGLEATSSCGNHLCANAGSCPNRVLNSGFIEAATVEA